MPNRKVGAVAAATFLVLSGGAGKRRRYWVRPSLLSRATYGACDLLADLRRDNLDPVTNRVTVTKRGHFKILLGSHMMTSLCCEMQFAWMLRSRILISAKPSQPSTKILEINR